MSTLAKPVLRGHLYRYGIKTLIACTLVTTTTSSLYYFLVAKPRRQAHIDFAKTYDEEEHMKELLKYDMLPTYKRMLMEKKERS